MNTIVNSENLKSDQRAEGKAAYMQEWRRKNAEHVRDYKARYRAENADYISAHRKEYLKNNPPDPEINRRACAKFRANNPERAKEIAHRHYWKDVEATRAKARTIAAKPENKARKSEREKKRYQENIEAQRERGRKQAAAKPEQARARKLKSKFNITVEQWEEIFDSQGRVCAICKSATPKKALNWHTDHCHSSGKVRGILCHGCNTGLGMFEDRPESLVSAANYLSKFTSEVVR